MIDAAPPHLLLVEDEAPFREVIAERLAEQGFHVEQAGTGEDAAAQLNGFAFDILITDLRLPGVDGRQLLDEAFTRYPEIIAIVITGFATIREAVEVTRLGAEGFITKPFQFEELMHELNAALEKRRLRAENDYLRSQLHERFQLDGMIGRTPIMTQLRELLRTVALTSSTVLISGRPAPARNWRRGRFTTPVRVGTSGSWRSIAARFPRRCWRPSSSATCAARSPARWRTARGDSSRRTAARCSSTKSAR